MKRNILFLAAMSVVSISFAQGEIDALRYSRNDLVGTARAMSMGGAFGALGGDITGVAINPAGIGVYRSSEVVGTINFENVSTETTLGRTLTDNKFKFNFDNIGYVAYYPSGSDDLLSYNFGFSYNRLKNYDRRYKTKGLDLSASLIDHIAYNSYDMLGDDLDNADGLALNYQPWLSVFAYNTLLMNPTTVNVNGRDHVEYTADYLDGVDNYLMVDERGSIASYDFTFGTNVSDMLLLGLTFSITDIDHRIYSFYEEDFYQSPISNDGFSLENRLTTKGTGYGLKVGAILKPIDALRIGVSYHSPTWYTMEDTYSAYMESYDGDLGSNDNYFDYRFQTPYKWNFSLAGIIGSTAIVSVDYELTGYSGMKFNTSDGDYSQDFENQNSNVKSDFKSSSTLRAGLEVRLTPQVSSRVGYAWAQTPMTKDVLDGNVEVITSGSIPHYVLEGDTHYYTIGLGYRFNKNFYMDFAMVAKQQTDKVYAFSNIFDGDHNLAVGNIPAKMKTDTFKGLLTFGYKF